MHHIKTIYRIEIVITIIETLSFNRFKLYITINHINIIKAIYHIIIVRYIVISFITAVTII